jgi:mycothiol system anti-sigma-R factor
MGGPPMGFGPGGIDCEDVVRDLFRYMDDESDREVRDRIRIHLEACGPCLKTLGLERDVKSLIARCCGGDVAPERLRERIRMRITEVSVQIAHVEYRAE